MPGPTSLTGCLILSPVYRFNRLLRSVAATASQLLKTKPEHAVFDTRENVVGFLVALNGYRGFERRYDVQARIWRTQPVQRLFLIGENLPAWAEMEITRNGEYASESPVFVHRAGIGPILHRIWTICHAQRASHRYRCINPWV